MLKAIDRRQAMAVLVFGSLWGLSEAALGEALYRAELPYAGVVLTVIAFALLTVAKAFAPWGMSGTLIGAVAMLYKLLNSPFFACHMLAIVLLGGAYDACVRAISPRSWPRRAVVGLAATYLGFAAFALTITFVVQYPHWARAGWPKVAHYVGVAGTAAAVLNAMLVPAWSLLAQSLRRMELRLPELRRRVLAGCAAGATAALWIGGPAFFALRHLSGRTGG